MQNLSRLSENADIATKAYVDSQGSNPFDVGDFKTSLAVQTDAWVPCDGRIVSAADYPALAELLGSFIKKIEIPDASTFRATDVAYFKGYYHVLGADYTYSGNPYVVVYAAQDLNGPWTKVFSETERVRFAVAKAQFATDGNYLIFTNGGTGWSTSGTDNAYWYATEPLGTWTKVTLTHVTASNCYYHWMDYENGQFVFLASNYQNSNTGSISFASDPTSAANWQSHVLGNPYAYFSGGGYARIKYHYLQDAGRQRYLWFTQPGQSGLIYYSADFLSSFSYILKYVSASVSSFVYFDGMYRIADKNERYYVYCDNLFDIADYQSGYTEVDMGKGNAPTYLMQYGSKLLGFNSTKIFLSSDGVSFDTVPINFTITGEPIVLSDGSYLAAGTENYIVHIKSPEGKAVPNITPDAGTAYVKGK